MFLRTLLYFSIAAFCLWLLIAYKFETEHFDRHDAFVVEPSVRNADVVKKSLSLEEVFSLRRDRIARFCVGGQPGRIYPWVYHQFTITDFTGKIKVCSIPKVAYTSWYETFHEFKERNIQPKLPDSEISTVITVRHPLDRLASAYRDKYIGGQPLSSYNNKWRNMTESMESWQVMWRRYWLPTFVVNGAVNFTDKYFSLLRYILNRAEEKLDSVDSSTFKRLSRKPLKSYSLKDMLDYVNSDFFMKVGYELLNNAGLIKHSSYNSMQWNNILEEVLRKGYHIAIMLTSALVVSEEEETKLMREFSNSSISFDDFINYVIKSHEGHYEDHHWMSYSKTCVPCVIHYDYVLHLENISSEGAYMFEKMGFPHHTTLKSYHRIKDIKVANRHSFSDENDQYSRNYFENVSHEIIRKLRNIYADDFKIFDYG